MATIISGKGVYIWKPERIGTPSEVANELVRSKTDFVAIKIHDGNYIFPHLEPYITEIRSKGIKVIGWGYVYLKWDALAEARAAIRAIQQYKPDVYLIDAEAEAKGQFAPALVFARTLRAGVGKLPLGLNSYWKPSYHPLLPWYQLRQVCDFDAPQVYWRGSRPTEKLMASKEEYARLAPRLPFSLPAGDMFCEGGLKPTPEQVQEFLAACRRDPEIQGTIMWSMDQKIVVPELWAVYSQFDWHADIDTIETLPAEPLYTATVTPWNGLKVRRSPNGEVLKVLRQGERVSVYAVEDGWACTAPDRSQWMYAAYLQPVSNISEPLYVAVVIPAEGLNVRRTPGGDKITALRKGERVDVYSIENGWACITPDRSRWVYAAYLKQI